MTPLEHAHTESTRSGNHLYYFDEFLRSSIFVATMGEPKDGSISPLIVELNGEQALIMFDSEEKFTSWANQAAKAEEEIVFSMFSGHTLVAMMEPDYHWVLNVQSEHGKVFTPPEIQTLKDYLVHAIIQDEDRGLTLVAEPVMVPDGLMDALTEYLASKNTDVKKAYLAQVSYLQENQSPLTILLETNSKDKAFIDALFEELNVLIGGFLNSDKEIDLWINHDSEITSRIIDRFKPFYTKKTSWLKMFSK